MANNRDLIILCLDTGSSMGNPLQTNEAGTALSTSKELALRILQQRMYHESKDLFSLVLFGTEETSNTLAIANSGSYNNITVARSFGLPDLDLLRYLKENVTSTSCVGDFFDALVVCLDLLNSSSKVKCQQKKIYVFTDAGCSFNDDEMDVILSGLIKLNVELVVIGPELNPSDEDCITGNVNHSPATNHTNNQNSDKLNAMKLSTHRTKAQIYGAKILERIISQVNASCFSFLDALKALTNIRKRTIKQTSVFRGNLQLGSKLNIPLHGFIRVKECKPSTWKKLSAIAQSSSHSSSMEVKISRTHHKNDEDQTEIESDQLVKGFSFGKTFIPWVTLDKGSLSLTTDKCLKVLGFVDSDSIRRSHFIGDNVVVFSPPPLISSDDGQSFAAFVQALFETKSAAIVRYCFRTNAPPKIGCLFPHIRTKYFSLLFVQLPYSEDVRQNLFASLSSQISNLTPQEAHVIDNLIDNMDLTITADDDYELMAKSYQPKLTCNPFLQRLYHSISDRAMDPLCKLQHCDDLIVSPTLESSTLCLTEIENLFQMTKVEKVAQKSKNPFKRDDDMDFDSSDIKKPKLDIEEDLDLASFLSTDTQVVGTVNPIDDFLKLIKIPLQVQSTFFQMQTRILQLVRDSFGDQNYPKALECLKTYRKSCITLMKPDSYNDYIKELRVELQGTNSKIKPRYYLFWDEIEKISLGLISSKECDKSSLSEEDCLAFSNENSTDQALETEPKGLEDELEDLLADM